jgi:hypothetical protein
MQILRWSSVKRSQTSHNTPQTSITITLPSPSYKPAAMSILAAMYGVDNVPSLLSALELEELVYAAVLADMWQLPGISSRR